jgi:hypothetical protein
MEVLGLNLDWDTDHTELCPGFLHSLQEMSRNALNYASAAFFRIYFSPLLRGLNHLRYMSE